MAGDLPLFREEHETVIVVGMDPELNRTCLAPILAGGAADTADTVGGRVD